MITLDEAKKHLNVEHNEDDAYIAELIAVAEQTISSLINRPLKDVLLQGELPAPLKHAQKIIIAKLYAYREGDKPGKAEEVAFTLSNLFMPYRAEK